MKNLQETWNDLKKYLEVDSALEQGFSNGKYTAILAKYAKNVTGIDISEDFLNVAKENLKDYKNINYYQNINIDYLPHNITLFIIWNKSQKACVSYEMIQAFSMESVLT